MKRLALVCVLLTKALFGQGTLTTTVTHQAKSPWLTPCSASVTRNCVKGWRVFDITAGRVALFEVPAPASFTGTVTGTGSGPVAGPTGSIVAQTIGIDFDGAELLSDDSVPSKYGVKPGAPTITVTIVIQGQ